MIYYIFALDGVNSPSICKFKIERRKTNMANVFDIDKQISEATKNLPSYDYILGRTLMQPFRPANSGSRALMNSIHTEHLMVPTHAEVPLTQTSFENEFGKKSSSFVTAKSTYKVIYKIDKFEHFPGQHYYLIVRDEISGEYDVIERLAYKYNTESYGYLWKNEILDRLSEGDIIPRDSVIKTSTGFDEYNNKMNGVNLRTLYLSCAQNMEDSVILSKSGAEKLGSSLIKNTGITINDNDVLVNLYGNENLYKTFPDVGEHTKDGIFCSIRRVENDNILYSLSQSRLREPMMSDRNIIIDGIVADIDVYCNNPSVLSDSYYNGQLFYYYDARSKFCQKIVDLVGPLAMNGKLSYNLSALYSTCRDSINGKQFFKDKLFSNVIMEITIISSLPMEPGDKMCDRYGGKGVVSKIVPDELMPMLDNGKRVEVIKNQSTCINRENIGQLHEQSLSFIGMRMIDAFKDPNCMYSYCNMCAIIYKFISMIDEDQARMMFSALDFFEDETACKIYMQSIFEDDGIILTSPPFTTPVDLDLIDKIYKAFPWIKPYEVSMPIADSNGNIRLVPARRKLIVGKIYNYRLKQYAEEKFSVTSLSATNLKGLNTRSRANKVFETKYTRTPIMFGTMETGDLVHLGMHYVVMNLMLYSSSPRARRLFEQLLIGDPYNIDIRLDTGSKNRNAEIINALMKTMGLRITFQKIPKKVKQLVLNVMCKDVPNKGYEYKTRIRDIIGHEGELEMHYGIALRDNRRRNKPMVGKVMVKGVDSDGYITKAGRELLLSAERDKNSDK